MIDKYALAEFHTISEVTGEGCEYPDIIEFSAEKFLKITYIRRIIGITNRLVLGGVKGFFK